MKSAVRRVLLMSALMSPGAVFALGLGEIRLNSALNQPFDADIELVSAADEDLSALRASLASSDTFTRYGLDKAAFLSDFSFRVVRGANGQDYLKVTSPRPVTEPFVTMLVEANWPRGRLLREYTVLLDPPVFAPAAQAPEAPVATPRVTAAPAAPPPPPPAPATAGAEPFASAPRPPAPGPSSAPAPRPRSAAAVAAPSAAAGSSYRVRPNDTLWEIASETYPGKRSDVNRAMVAIYQSNPQAFDGNINLLRAGSMLKLPAASDVSAIPATAAAAEVARQYRMWKDGTPAAAASADTAGGRLRLVTPEQGTPAASTATTAAPAAPAAAAPGAGQADLQNRVQQLEAELAEAKRLLEVRNAELATLQGPAAGAAPSGTTPTEVPAATAPAATPAEGTPSAEAPAAPVEAAPEPAPKPAQPAKVKKPEPEEGPTLLERLGGYWWLLLGLLAAALAWLFYKRSRTESGAAEEGLQEALARPASDLRARPAVVTARPREADILVEERRPAESAPAHVAAAAATVAAVAPHAPEPSRRPVSIDDTLSGEGPLNIESGDPLAEADFHMAYGLYDQAADLVQLAIKREPLRRDLRLKLLEIFFVWGNRDRFLELAREMRASSGDAQPGEWDKVLIMGKQLAPDDPLFAGAVKTTPASLDLELHGSAGAIDMDLGAESITATDIDLHGDTTLAAGEAGLDFVIDEPQRGGEDTGTLAPTIETPRLRARPATEEPTQEVPIEQLGIDVSQLEGLDEAAGGEDLVQERPRSVVEDTVETPRPARQAEPEDEDLLSATGILQQTGMLKALDESELSEADAADSTGELPVIDEARGAIARGGVDYASGEEPATMSEVGTKLDLARAYMDMGDPEGARSILDEVLREGNATQKQEAERLVANLP